MQDIILIIEKKNKQYRVDPISFVMSTLDLIQIFFTVTGIEHCKAMGFHEELQAAVHFPVKQNVVCCQLFVSYNFFYP